MGERWIKEMEEGGFPNMVVETEATRETLRRSLLVDVGSGWAPLHVRATAAHLSAWIQVARQSAHCIAAASEQPWTLIYEHDTEWFPAACDPKALRDLITKLPSSADFLLLGCLSEPGLSPTHVEWILSACSLPRTESFTRTSKEEKEEEKSSTTLYGERGMRMCKLTRSVHGMSAYLLRPRGAQRLLDIVEAHNLLLRYELKESQKTPQVEHKDPLFSNPGGFYCKLAAASHLHMLTGLPLGSDSCPSLPRVNGWIMVHEAAWSSPTDTKSGRGSEPVDHHFWFDFVSTGYRGFRHVQGMARRRRKAWTTSILSASGSSAWSVGYEARVPSDRSWQADARQLREAGFWQVLLVMMRRVSEDTELSEEERDWTVWDECVRAAVECGHEYRSIARGAMWELLRRNVDTCSGRARLKRELARDPTRIQKTLSLVGDSRLTCAFRGFCASLGSLPL